MNSIPTPSTQSMIVKGTLKSVPSWVCSMRGTSNPHRWSAGRICCSRSTSSSHPVRAILSILLSLPPLKSRRKTWPLADRQIWVLGSQGAGAMRGVWRDSFHSSEEFTISEGKAEGPGEVQILGHYSAPSGPDWGWRTHLRTDGEDRFEITMVNIAPGGEETPAVRMEFGRTVGSD